MNKQITQVAEKNPKQNQAVPEKPFKWWWASLKSSFLLEFHVVSVPIIWQLPALKLHLLPRCLLYNHTVHRVLSGQWFSCAPPPPFHPTLPASSCCVCLLMTYSPLFGKNVHLLCGLLYCYPLLLVVIEPSHISWSHGDLALGLHLPVSLAICDHMTKLR